MSVDDGFLSEFDPVLCHPALTDCSVLENHPPHQKLTSTAEATSPPQIHERKMSCHFMQISLLICFMCKFCTFVFVSGHVTRFLEKMVFPVLIPGLEALLREAQQHNCFEVCISPEDYMQPETKMTPD